MSEQRALVSAWSWNTGIGFRLFAILFGLAAIANNPMAGSHVGSGVTGLVTVCKFGFYLLACLLCSCGAVLATMREVMIRK